MIVFQILDITKNCVINTDHVTFFIINLYSPHEMNGNLLIFNCIDVRLKLCSSATFYIFVWDKPCGWFWWKKTKQGCEIFFPNFQICHNQFFLLENPTHWGLETAVCPIFAKPVLDIFAVCSLVPCMNLSHTQKSYLCSKNQNYLLEKDLTFSW